MLHANRESLRIEDSETEDNVSETSGVQADRPDLLAGTAADVGCCIVCDAAFGSMGIAIT